MRYIFLLSAILLFAAPAFAAFPMHAAGNSETIAQHDIVHNSVAHVERMMPGHRAAGHGFAYWLPDLWYCGPFHSATHFRYIGRGSWCAQYEEAPFPQTFWPRWLYPGCNRYYYCTTLALAVLKYAHKKSRPFGRLFYKYCLGITFC